MYSESAKKLKARIENLSNNTINTFSRVIDGTNTPRSYLKNSLQAIWNIADIIDKKTLPYSLEQELSEWFKCIEEQEGKGVLKIDETTLELGQAFLEFINTILNNGLRGLSSFNKLRQLQTELNQKIINFKPPVSRSSSMEDDDPSADHKDYEPSLHDRLTPESSNQEPVTVIHEEHLSEEPRSAQEPLFVRAELRRKLLNEYVNFLVNYKAMLKKRPPEYPNVDSLLKCLESYSSDAVIEEFKRKYKASETLQHRNKPAEGGVAKKESLISRLHKPNDPFLKNLKIEIKGKIKLIKMELRFEDISQPPPMKGKIKLRKAPQPRFINPTVETLFDLQTLYSNVQALQSLERERLAKQEFLDCHNFLAKLRISLEEMEAIQVKFDKQHADLETRLEAQIDPANPLTLEILTKLTVELDDEVLAIKQVLIEFQEKLSSVSQPSDFLIPKEISEKITKLQAASISMGQKLTRSETILSIRIKGNLSILQEQKKQENLSAYTHYFKHSWRIDFFGSDQKLDRKSRMGSYIADQKSNCFFNKQDGVDKENMIVELRMRYDAFVADAGAIGALKTKISEGITKFQHTRTFFGGKEKSFKHQLEALQAVVIQFEKRAL